MGEFKLSSLLGFRAPSHADAATETRSNAEPAPAQSTSRMVTLARKIASETEKLETYMRENNLPMPSFEVDAPADFPTLPADIQRSRQEIICATRELGLLAHGPRESLRWGVWEVSGLSASASRRL